MRKIIKLLKKICLGIAGFFSIIYTKVLAVEMQMVEILYGPPVQDLYGVPRTNTTPLFWRFARSLFIPLAFIIGIIIYLKNSSAPKYKKFITVLISLIIVILVCFGINYIIINI